MGACVHDLEGAVGKIFLRNFPLCCCRGGQQRAGEGQEAPKGFKQEGQAGMVLGLVLLPLWCAAGEVCLKHRQGKQPVLPGKS